MNFSFDFFLFMASYFGRDGRMKYFDPAQLCGSGMQLYNSFSSSYFELWRWWDWMGVYFDSGYLVHRLAGQILRSKQRK